MIIQCLQNHGFILNIPKNSLIPSLFQGKSLVSREKTGLHRCQRVTMGSDARQHTSAGLVVQTRDKLVHQYTGIEGHRPCTKTLSSTHNETLTS